MAAAAFTLVTELGATRADVTVTDDPVWLPSDAFEAATGWTIKPEGFCRGAVCIPAGAAVDGARVDLAAFARLTDRPLVVDADAYALSLGAAPAERVEALAGLEAPDFELPDLTGTMHRLSDYRGKKVLLAAYASW